MNFGSACLHIPYCGQKGLNAWKGVLDSKRPLKSIMVQIDGVGICCDKGRKEDEGSTSTFSEHLFIPMSLRPKYVAVDMDVSQGGGGIGGGKH